MHHLFSETRPVRTKPNRTTQHIFVCQVYFNDLFPNQRCLHTITTNYVICRVTTRVTDRKFIFEAYLQYFTRPETSFSIRNNGQHRTVQTPSKIILLTRQAEVLLSCPILRLASFYIKDCSQRNTQLSSREPHLNNTSLETSGNQLWILF